MLRATEIRIFSAPAGEGQFPMTKPGQTMTNATVKQVVTGATVKQISGGQTTVIKLTFHGADAPGSQNCSGRAADAPGGPGKGCVGETEFAVPAGVPVVAHAAGAAVGTETGSQGQRVPGSGRRPTDRCANRRFTMISGDAPVI